MRTAALILAAALLAGCSGLFKRPDPHPAPPAEAPYLSKVSVERPADPPTPAPAVESALVLSEKYTRAVEDLSAEKQKTRDLTERARVFSAEIADLKAQLARAQQELSEANQLLIEVRGENERWKADILGYRDEMRHAHQTELEALFKVLKLLGAELPDAGVAAAPPAETAPDGASGPSEEGDSGADTP